MVFDKNEQRLRCVGVQIEITMSPVDLVGSYCTAQLNFHVQLIVGSACSQLVCRDFA